jgi:hypothetical protein
MDDKKGGPTVDTLQHVTSHAEGHLEKRFSKLTMTGMAFAILKYVVRQTIRISNALLTNGQHVDCSRKHTGYSLAIWWSSGVLLRLHLLCTVQFLPRRVHG